MKKLFKIRRPPPPLPLPPGPRPLSPGSPPPEKSYINLCMKLLRPAPSKKVKKKRRRLKVSTRPLKFYLFFIPNIPHERRASLVIGLIISPCPSVISKNDSPASFLRRLMYCLSDRYGDKSSSNIDSPLRA